MIERSAIVQNAQGIHCRPSAVIIKEFQHYPGDILVAFNEHSCNLQSVMGLLALGLHKDCKVTIRVSGPDEETSCNRIVELFETEFDFPPRLPEEDALGSASHMEPI
ncbi:MAG: hypothetical protein A2X46_02480 [Lentisphaerae bacterium GWF2_57_35]|nr:MAG: hypothetical protein A2X46_02480 [Lentisphaerae bacterium GWF2_57_35]